jgi:cytochrome c biogenesis factor
MSIEIPKYDTPEQARRESKKHLMLLGSVMLGVAGVGIAGASYYNYENNPSQKSLDEVMTIENHSTVSEATIEALRQIDSEQNQDYLDKISTQMIQDEAREADDLNKSARNEDFTQPDDTFVLEIYKSRNEKSYSLDIKPLVDGKVITEDQQ